MLEKEFFKKDTISLAKDLLGKIIVRKIDKGVMKAKIVETEAYLGISDRACHTFNNNKTERNKILYMDCGTLYVYQTYGIHFLLNISSVGENVPEGVLIRAVEPITDLDMFSINRFNKLYKNLSTYQKNNLTNGPAKLTKALQIDKSFNWGSIFGKNLYIEDSNYNFEINIDRRVGIDYAKEARDFPYRFFIKNNPFVSKNIQE